MSWMNFLKKQGAGNDMRDFGDLIGELHNARASTVIVPLIDLGMIAVVGEDSASFLHNILTNDIKGLGKDGACLGGLCSPKGRLLATMLIWPVGEGFQLALSAD